MILCHFRQNITLNDKPRSLQWSRTLESSGLGFQTRLDHHTTRHLTNVIKPHPANTETPEIEHLTLKLFYVFIYFGDNSDISSSGPNRNCTPALSGERSQSERSR